MSKTEIKPFRFKRFPSKDKQKSLVVYLATYFYKVKVEFVKPSRFLQGIAFFTTNRQGVPKILMVEDKRHDYLNSFFHEAGHLHCWNNNIWPSYHDKNMRYRKYTAYWTSKDLQAKIYTAYKAECWVDRWAEVEMKKWFPNLEYSGGYSYPESKKWLKKHYLSRFKAIIKSRQKRKK